MTTAATRALSSRAPSAPYDPPPAWKPLAGLLAVAGVGHFVLRKPFESIVPKRLGDPGPYVTASGIAELALAAGLAHPRTRRAAALGAAVLFVSVYPANIDMTYQAFKRQANPVWKWGTVGRLPLQVPLVVRSLQIARAARKGGPRP